MRIGDRVITPGGPPYVIAEIGVNHDGSVERALSLADAAAAAGADAIKLQLFEADRLLSRAARLAAYQRVNGNGNGDGNGDATDPFTLLRALEMPVDRMAGVVTRAHASGLHAIVSVFSRELVADAERLPFDAYKVASPDLINTPLIRAMMATGKPIVLSAGAATRAEVERAVAGLADHPHVLMHCVSCYPTPDDEAGLGGRLDLTAIDPWALGYSDHTTSIDTGGLAVASGACVLEKHLTWDRNAKGPDHAASLAPDAFAQYVELAHRAWRMRGAVHKGLRDVERDVRVASRQSLTTTRALPAGHVLARGDLTVKRPGTGLPPFELEAVEGRRLARAIEADMPLTPEHVA